jgi:hypothetical protein
MYKMIPIEQIRKMIEGEIFDYSQLMHVLSHYRKPRDTVSILLKRGHIIRVRKGLYVFGPIWRRTPVKMETLANLVYGPSALSTDYALASYGLIPERVNTYTSICPGRSREFNTPEGRFSYTQLTGKRFSVGLIRQSGSGGSYLIAEPLKALADKVWTDSRFKPTSTASYTEYLFEDLRIDEDTLAAMIIKERIEAIEEAFSTRKVLWLMQYLLKRFGGL